MVVDDHVCAPPSPERRGYAPRGRRHMI